MYRALVIASSILAVAQGQQVGTQTTETHPGMTWQQCTAKGSCTSKSGKIVLDSNWRWLHTTKGTDNCYDGNKWIDSLCKDNKACASSCALDGADYKGTYGITASGNSLTLKFVTKGSYSTNIGSRTYLMKDDSTYEMFTLAPDREFTFDVDVSNLPCGLNGALYFVSMDADGGLKKYSTNKAGAKYGTGYCDAQCPRDLKFINGEANVEGWKPSENDQNAGVGNYGSCCSEMDIWEANSVSTAYTPHACTTVGQSRCEGNGCGGTYADDRYAGPCDADGCDFNSFRQGDTTFYGKGKTIDTSKKFTVVTQFHGSGESLDIKRFYVQGGTVYANSESKIDGLPGNSLTSEFCTNQKTVFGDRDSYKEKGGHAGMSKALTGGMVLVMSLWDDHAANMLWLDSNYPTDKDATVPGIARGECETTSGVPADVEKNTPGASVIYSNIKVGPLNSTFG